MKTYGQYYEQYKSELKNPMKESLLGFCHWLIERLNKFDVPVNAKWRYWRPRKMADKMFATVTITPYSKTEWFWIKLWLFFGETGKAQKVVLDHIKRDMNGK